ncbi:hypothetical protein ATK86_4945 [Nocardia fluminea]|uniref:Uncharacterized protein n=2 Tax=Nocardia fluminea TaxID=134984 RepID=A0A2N3VFZ5_9NOCA|nr:hypothetical protein ATK86_4945 [Nocardia fluminea]
MDGVGTSIVGRPRRPSADRRARPTYTLIWEEPLKKHPREYITNMKFGFFASINIPDANQSPHILPTMREIREYVQTVLDDLKKAGVK